MLKINENLRVEILHTFFEAMDTGYEIKEMCEKIQELYEKIKKKDYNNYESFLDILCELIIYIEKLSIYADLFADILYDNLNYILDNMKENWDLSNEKINNRVEFLFNQLKDNYVCKSKKHKKQ